MLAIGASIVQRRAARMRTDDAQEETAPAITRRDVEKLGLAAGLALLATGCPSPEPAQSPAIDVSCKPAPVKAGEGAARDEYDYVVIGSGAGGGPVACNLARAGFEAALDEAGRVNPHQLGDAVRMVLRSDQALWDPNDWRMVKAVPEGMIFVPLHVNRGARSGTREYVRAVASACPSNLHVELDALASRVVLDGEKRAVAVEYLKGARLYRASASPSVAPGDKRVVRARREIILSGGVFNSPQLLMLSGIGAGAELAKHGIEPAVELPGVGKNLQDRYEIGVTSEMAQDFEVLRGARLVPPEPGAPDPALQRWWFDRTGPYTTNGVVGAIVKRSKPALPVPDLFLFGIVGNFKGYYRGYARDLVADHRHFTWGVLKAHTKNTAGEVKLRSADPRDRPSIDFRYFEQGGQEDLDAVVEGVLSVRRLMGTLGDKVRREVLPGPDVRSRDAIARYVRDHAWGHHASCTNKMGPRSDPTAVVDQRFRVHGTRGLLVVDASVFPRIPGFFIVTSVYAIAEKASDVILGDARG